MSHVSFSEWVDIVLRRFLHNHGNSATVWNIRMTMTDIQTVFEPSTPVSFEPQPDQRSHAILCYFATHAEFQRRRTK